MPSFHLANLARTASGAYPTNAEIRSIHELKKIELSGVNKMVSRSLDIKGYPVLKPVLRRHIHSCKDTLVNL